MLRTVYFVILLLFFTFTAAVQAKKNAKLHIHSSSKVITKLVQKNDNINNIIQLKQSQFNQSYLEKQIYNLLYLHGYFDASVEIDYQQTEHNFNIYIDHGTHYTISSIDIDQPSSVFTPYYLLKIRRGDLFSGKKILAAEKNIIEFLTSTECRYIKRVKHHVKLNEAQKTADIIFDVGVSPSSVFGKTTINGLKSVKESVFTPLLNYKKGACYTEQDINKTIKEAINTNLFNNIYFDIKPHKKNKQGVSIVDVIYNINERKHRTLNYGVGFSDTELFIVSAGHQWRNLFGSGVMIDAQTRLSDRTQTLNLDAIYPSYFGYRENLKSVLTFGRQRFNSYNSDGLSLFSGYEKIAENGRHLSYGIGVQGNYAEVTESAVLSEKYFIAGAPFFILHDTKNSLLRPSKGHMMRLDTIPTLNILSKDNHFIKNQITATDYFNLGTIGTAKTDAPSILAFRGKIGSIIGSDLNDIPIIERFYAGGGGSVRGYDYQNLGALQRGQSQGGASLFEASAELRIGIKKNYGLTFFLDAGNVYDTAIPDITNDNLQFAAGIGGRYYSDILPIRLDIGIPLNPRSGRNDNFGFYFGIGESF